MMHAFSNRALCTVMATIFCFSLLTALMASGRSVASSTGMMRQMMALKREIEREGETPALGEKYDRLANQIHEVCRQIARTDTSLSTQPSAPAVNTCIAGRWPPAIIPF
jgi:hypothetical protein